MKKKEEMSILVVSSDGYADVTKNFFPIFENFWPDCKYPLYLVNDKRNDKYNNVTVINSGDNFIWSNRVKYALEQINSEYVLLLLEDYYIGKKVSNEVIDKAIDFIKKENIKYYKISNLPKGKSKFKNYDNIAVIPKNQRYGLSLQAAIWKKSFLLETLGEEDISAWEVETNQIKKINEEAKGAIEGAVVNTSNIIDIRNSVIKGEWVPEVIKYFKKQGIIIETGNRKQMSKKSYLMFVLQRKLINILPSILKKKTKKILSIFGMKFVTK